MQIKQLHEKYEFRTESGRPSLLPMPKIFLLKKYMKNMNDDKKCEEFLLMA